jgi:hypothetical protein
MALRAAQQIFVQSIMRSLALLPEKIFAPLRLYWRLLDIFYQSYLTVEIGIPTLIHFLYLHSAI